MVLECDVRFGCAGAGEVLCLAHASAAEPILWRTLVAPCALLSIDCVGGSQVSENCASHPERLNGRRGPTQTDLLLASAMDGQVHVVSGAGAVLASVKVAGRLVPKVAWCPAPVAVERGATGAERASVHAHEADEARNASAGVGGDGTAGNACANAMCPRSGLALAATGASELVALRWVCNGEAAELRVVQRIAFAANVADVAFVRLVPPPAARDDADAGLDVVVAVREAHELRVMPLHVSDEESPVQVQVCARAADMRLHAPAFGGASWLSCNGTLYGRAVVPSARAVCAGGKAVEHERGRRRARLLSRHSAAGGA